MWKDISILILDQWGWGMVSQGSEPWQGGHFASKDVQTKINATYVEGTGVSRWIDTGDRVLWYN